MPYDLVTPFGVRPGQVSPEEEMNQRTQMTNMQLMAQAQIAALQGQTERDVQGTYGQRSQQDMRMQQMHDQAQLGLVGAEGDQRLRAVTAGQAPEMGRLGMEQQAFQEAAPARAALQRNQIQDADFQSMLNGLSRDMLTGGGGSAGAPGAPGAPMAPGAQTGAGAGGFGSLPVAQRLAAIASMRKGGGPTPDFEQQNIQHQLLALGLQDQREAHARTRSQQFLDSGDAAAAQQEAQAGGVATPHLAGGALDTDPVMSQKLAELVTAVNGASSAFGSGNAAAVTKIMGDIQDAGKAKGYLPQDVHAWMLKKVDALTGSSPLWQRLRTSPLLNWGPSAGENIRDAVGLPTTLQ